MSLKCFLTSSQENLCHHWHLTWLEEVSSCLLAFPGCSFDYICWHTHSPTHTLSSFSTSPQQPRNSNICKDSWSEPWQNAVGISRIEGRGTTPGAVQCTALEWHAEKEECWKWYSKYIEQNCFSYLLSMQCTNRCIFPMVGLSDSLKALVARWHLLVYWMGRKR